MDYNKKELYTAKRSSNVQVDDPAIASTWEQVRSDAVATNWMLLYLSQPTVVAVKASGSGGIEELIQNLSDDDIFFGAIRCKIGGGIKFIHIYFVGSNVGEWRRARHLCLNRASFKHSRELMGRFNSSTGPKTSLRRECRHRFRVYSTQQLLSSIDEPTDVDN